VLLEEMVRETIREIVEVGEIDPAHHVRRHGATA
jgi:hypothetical protein